MQNETSDASWSFLDKQSEKKVNGESDSKQPNTSFIQQNSWKNYAFVLIILGFIGMISIINSRYTQIKPAWVLNQVIDLIVEGVDVKNIQLVEANFSMDKVKVIIRSEDFANIQSLTQKYRMENKIPYEMYQKGKNNYLILIFPWKGNKIGGNIQTLQSMAEKTVFYTSNKISIKHTEDTFEIQGGSSVIISLLLQWAENEQLQKFNFSVVQNESEQFNLIVRLNLI